jgi:hypothetical protein
VVEAVEEAPGDEVLRVPFGVAAAAEPAAVSMCFAFPSLLFLLATRSMSVQVVQVEQR